MLQMEETVVFRSTNRRQCLAMLSLLTLVACATTQSRPEVMPTACISAAVANPERSEADRARDLRDRPAEVLALAEFKPGMRIADIFGEGGYYSELLAYLVGANGHVVLVNNPAYQRFGTKDQAGRFKDGRLSQIERVLVPDDSLGTALGQNTLDGALIVKSYHDLYYENQDKFPHIDATLLAAQTLHRIDERFAIGDFRAHGFELIKTWDGLRNPADDRSKSVFDPAVRGRTDRFVHVYRRI
jgi:predicted methyltransferase